MTEIIIPVKPPVRGKQRLAEVLTVEQRATLVLSMLRDVLSAATKLARHNVWVITADDEVGTVAQGYGATVIAEKIVGGYNQAVETAISHVVEYCGDESAVAILPADVPCVTSDELGRLVALTSDLTTDLSAHPAANPKAHLNTDRRNVVRLAPSHDAQGTNGLFLSHPTMLKPAFGSDSFHRYRKRTNEQSYHTEIVELPGLACDIDHPADLVSLLAGNVDNHTSGYLMRIYRELNLTPLTREYEKNHTVVRAG